MRKFSLFVLIVVVLLSIGFSASPSEAEGEITPWLLVTVNKDKIGLRDFPQDEIVDVSIYSSQGGALLASIAIQVSGGEADIPSSMHLLDIVAGNHVVAIGRDSFTIVSHTVKLVQITGVNTGSNTITGIAESSTEVVVKACLNESCFKKTTTSNPNGDWIAVFSDDITDSMDIIALVYDTSESRTKYVLYPPNFSVERRGGEVECWGYTPNNTVSVEIYESPGGTLLSGPDQISTDKTGRCIDYDFTMEIGNHVKVIDDQTGITKTTIVKDINLSRIDENNTYYGTCNGCTEVEVSAHEPGDMYANTGPVNQTNWNYQITLSIPNLVPGRYYLRLATVYDDDGDGTETGIFPDYFIRERNNTILLSKFEPGSDVKLSILNDQGTIEFGPQSYTINGQGELKKLYSDHGVDILPGYKIEVADGSNVLLDSLVKADIELLKVNRFADVLSGIAPASSDVTADVIDGEDMYFVRAQSDTSGDWTADFTPHDVETLQDHRVKIKDVDGDETQDLMSTHDKDGDLVSDSIDNAVETHNWDQSDLDGDGIGDVDDPCPSDIYNLCDKFASIAISIGAEGGDVVTPDGTASVIVPPESLPIDTSISITDQEAGFSLVADGEEATALTSMEVGPPGTQFQVPAEIVMTWNDKDNNGIVDGTSIYEWDLFISKDGKKITGTCGSKDPGCDMNANKFVVEVTSLSEFVLATFDVPGNIDVLPIVVK
jgi:hypothetical protein